MSDENFLGRWARLKQEAKHPERDVPEAPAAVQPPEEPSCVAAADPVEAVPELPPIDSITAATDVRAFLSAHVPTALKHGALRAAWAADPAIRDFVGLSENSWDFNAPETIPGFAGPLSPGESTHLARLFDRVGQAGEMSHGDDAPTPVDTSPHSAELKAAEQQECVASDAPDQNDAEDAHIESAEPLYIEVAEAAADVRADGEGGEQITARRGHGGALPT